MCTVSSGSGTVAAANVTNISVSCVTPEANRTWHTVTQIEQDDAHAEESARLATNSQGSAVLVWRQRPQGQPVQIFASRYAPDSKTWSTPAVIGEQDGGVVGKAASVAIAANGDAVAVWPRVISGQGETEVDQVWASRYTAAGGWSSASRIDTATGSATSPQVVFDSAGIALVSWVQLEGSSYHVYSTRLNTLAAAKVDNTTGSADNIALAADAHGNVFAVWEQTDSLQAGTPFHAWTSTYRSDTNAWSAPQQIGTGTSSAFDSNVVCNPNGDAVAWWVEFDGSVWSNRYTQQGGWEAQKQISAPGESIFSPRLTIDQQGNALAIWSRLDEQTTDSHIWYSLLPAGGEWSSPSLLSSADSATSERTDTPQIAFDAQGDALALWDRSDRVHDDARFAIYSPAGGWSAPVNADNNGGDIIEPALAITPDGSAFAAWQQDLNGVSNLAANRFE